MNEWIEMNGMDLRECIVRVVVVVLVVAVALVGAAALTW